MDIKTITISELLMIAEPYFSERPALKYLRTLNKKSTPGVLYIDAIERCSGKKKDDLLKEMDSFLKCVEENRLTPTLQPLESINPRLTLGDVKNWSDSTTNNITYLTTLSKRYTDDTSMVDILRGGNGKKITELIDIITKNNDAIEEYIVSSNTKLTLPKDDTDLDFYSLLKKFILEYQVSRFERSGNQDHARRSDICVRETYICSPGHEEVMARRDLAVLLNIPNGRCVSVDNYLKAFISECKSLLVNGESVNGVIASDGLVNEIREIKERLGSIVSLDTIRKVTGIKDERTLEFLCDVLGLKKSESNYSIIKCASCYPLRLFDANLGKVLQFFREEVIHIRFDIEYMAFLRNQFGTDTQLIDMFADFVRHSCEFVWGDEQGQDVVALRWDLLQFDPAEVCWILYEQNATSLGTALSSEEIKKLYKRKAKAFGMQKTLASQVLSTAQKDRCWRLCNIGKAKFWMLRNNRSYEFDLDKVALEYYKSNGTSASLNGFLEYATKEGFGRMYNQNYIAQAYPGPANNGGQVKRNTYSDEERAEILDFIKMIITEHGSALAFPDLCDSISANYPHVKPTTIRQWLKSNDTVFTYIANKGGKTSAYVVIKGMEESAPSTYRDQIKSDAVDYLLDQPKYTDLRKNIYNIFTKDIPDGLNCASALSSIFGDKDLFIRTEDLDNEHATISLTEIAINEGKARRIDFIDELIEVKDLNEETANEAYLRSPSYEWEELKAILKEKLNGPFKKIYGFSMDKALNATYYIMANGEKKVDPNSTFNDMLCALPDYFKKNLASDRARSLKKDCSRNVEIYLKNFYSLKYGRSIVDDIQYNWNTSRPGLGVIMTYLDKLNLLPNKQFYNKYSVEYEIKQITQRVKEDRDAEIGHTENILDNSSLAIEQRIQDVFTLFVYVASKL